MRLLDFQQRLLDERYQDSMALFMDMGTGKTYMGAGAFERSGCKKLLIICLVSKIDDWAELLGSDMGYDVMKLNRGKRKNKEGLQSGADVMVVSFETAWRLGGLLDWVDTNTYIIVDESHKFKSPTSKIGKFMLKLGKRTKHKAILTGTPQSKGYIDYYTQLTFLDALDGLPLKGFKDRYCVIQDRWYGGRFPVSEIVGYKNTDELDEIIGRKAIFYQRVGGEVPIESVVKFKVGRYYKKLKKERVYEKRDGSIKLYDSKGSLYMGLRMASSGIVAGEVLNKARLDWVRDFVEGYDKRVVIFYNFNQERDALMDALKDYPVSEYSGRVKNLDRFLEDERGVVLANYGSASTGINELVVANMVIMYSLPSNFIDFAQAKKRIDRIGQERVPMYYYLMAEGTVEMAVYNSLMMGQDFDDNLFDKYLEII